MKATDIEKLKVGTRVRHTDGTQFPALSATNPMAAK